MVGLLKKTAPFILILLLVSCSSTNTSQKQYVEAEAYVKQRNYNAAAMTIEDVKGTAYKEKDRVLYYLDVGMLYHYAGRYEESNTALTEAEYAIEELYTNSISKSIGSGVLNDNARDYDGEIYEDLYLNVFKALNYIALGDTESALVEVRRLNNKMQLLQDKYDALYGEYSRSGEEQQVELDKITNEFHNNALARYLGVILYRAMGDYDDARIDREYFDKSFLSQPLLYPFPVVQAPDARPAEGTAIPVNVLAFTGQSPGKKSVTYYIDSTAHQLHFTTVDQGEEDYLRELTDIDSFIVPGLSYGFHMKLQFPKMFERDSGVDQIKVYGNGELVGDLGLTENIQLVAQATFAAELPLIVGKTVTRAIAKGIAKEVSQSATNSIIDDQIGGLGGELFKLAVGVASDVAVDATENADLRISNFFPAKAFTGEFYLEPGIYDFRIEYYRKGSLIFTDNLGEREINRYNSILESVHMF
ncbi:MAG: hypothetical protein PQJ59_04060 [Spirochaetales bacterium]|nr:hypothetical protein [Spirochaetales bacterium]